MKTTTLRDHLLRRISTLAATLAAARTVADITAAQLEAALRATQEGRLVEAQATVARMEASLAGAVAA